MTFWNFTPAPKSTKGFVERIRGDAVQSVSTVHDVWIIAALPGCDRVGKTRWLPDAERWEGMSKGQEPVAWMPWPAYPKLEQSQ